MFLAGVQEPRGMYCAQNICNWVFCCGLSCRPCKEGVSLFILPSSAALVCCCVGNCFATLPVHTSSFAFYLKRSLIESTALIKRPVIQVPLLCHIIRLSRQCRLGRLCHAGDGRFQAVSHLAGSTCTAPIARVVAECCSGASCYLFLNCYKWQE